MNLAMFVHIQKAQAHQKFLYPTNAGLGLSDLPLSFPHTHPLTPLDHCVMAWDHKYVMRASTLRFSM